MGMEGEFRDVSENLESQGRDKFDETTGHAREMVVAELPKATNLTEFMMLTDTLRELDPKVLGSWVDKEFWNIGPGQLIEEVSKENIRPQYEKEVEYARVLQQQIGVRQSSSSVQVAVMKVEEESPLGPVVTYRGFAVLPSGQRIADYGMPRVMPVVSSQDEVYIRFSAVCNEQAAQTILGELPITTFDVDNLPLSDAFDMLGFDISSTVQQNFKYRDEAGNTVGTRDPKLYILFAVKGGFNNENKRYLISDFNPPSDVTASDFSLTS